MAYPISETFGTGIPGGFATAAGSGMSVAYHAGSQAVDLSAAVAVFPLWQIDAAPLAGDFFAEFDLELLADGSGIQHVGIWLLTGSGYTGYRFAQQGGQPYNFKLSWFDAAGTETSNRTVLSPESHLVGVRKTWRVDYLRAGGLGRMVFSLDGVPMIDSVDVAFTNVRPAVFAYGCTVRVHSVTADAGSSHPYVAPGARGLLQGLMPMSLGAQGNQPGPPAAHGFAVRVARRDAYFGGGGRLRGTVAEKGTPSNLPRRRRVLALEEVSLIVVGETWSDAVTGAYELGNVDPTRKYKVISEDYTGAFRDVIANGQVPEPML
nr:hypothetical protein [uncultured Albidiferax sp.]